VLVQRAIVEHGRTGARVRGVLVARHGRERSLPASVVIAADGRRSRLAFGLGLARHPTRPRRWAIGGYLGGVRGAAQPTERLSEESKGRESDALYGEMHVRRNGYVGVAPLPGGLTND
jgi:2-polyprenyl-6-methoxyphenol hydroxylase-like FAD-dependent oxidoreductase